MAEKNLPKHVTPITDKFYENCVDAARFMEENPEKTQTTVPSRSAGYKIVYSRMEGVKKGILKCVWHEDPLLGTKEYRLIQVCLKL